MAEYENKAFEPDEEKVTATKVENHAQHNGVANGRSLRYFWEIENCTIQIQS